MDVEIADQAVRAVALRAVGERGVVGDEDSLRLSRHSIRSGRAVVDARLIDPEIRHRVAAPSDERTEAGRIEHDARRVKDGVTGCIDAHGADLTIPAVEGEITVRARRDIDQPFIGTPAAGAECAEPQLGPEGLGRRGLRRREEEREEGEGYQGPGEHVPFYGARRRNVGAPAAGERSRRRGRRRTSRRGRRRSPAGRRSVAAYNQRLNSLR